MAVLALDVKMQATMGFDDILVVNPQHNVSSTRSQHLVDSEEVLLLAVVGDALGLAGAAAYSLYIFRIGVLVGKGLPGNLRQAWKNAFLTVMFVLWGSGDYIWWAMNDLSDEMHPWRGWTHLMSWLLIAISAFLPGFCADLAQTKGQEVISAAESQVFLSGEPLWAAMFGFLLLGENLGPAEYLGGVLIIAGALVVTGIFGCQEEHAQNESEAMLTGSPPVSPPAFTGLASQSNQVPSADLMQINEEAVPSFEDKQSARTFIPGAVVFGNPLLEEPGRT